MIDLGRFNVLGVMVNAIDYEAATDRIITAAEARQPCAVTALAVHGVMTAVRDDEHRHRLNHLDLVVPDGQPVRWALNLLHGTHLRQRVYGPELTLRVCQRAAQRGLAIYLYGSKPDILAKLSANLRDRFDGLVIAGAEPSRFRRLSDDEQAATLERIKASGARIVLVGLGCPRQEVWAYESRDALGVPIMAVGAAFDFHAGTLSQAPPWMQRRGLEWLYRLAAEPRRLWRRYLLLNPAYLACLLLQWTHLRRFDPRQTHPPKQSLNYG